jgi:DNA-binding SARP family transcriptional activator
VQVLGPVRAWRDGDELDLGPARRRAVLALLALSAGRAIGQEALVAALWKEPPRSARNIIHTYVKHLRQVMEPERSSHSNGTLLSRVGDGYALRVDAGTVDGLRLRKLVAEAQAARRGGDAARVLATAGAALAMWQEPLGGLPFLADHPSIVALGEDRWAAAGLYVDTALALGQAGEVVALVEEAATARPLDESCQARLLRVYHVLGRRADALMAYDRLRRGLADELGVDPGPELRQAYEALLRGDAAPVPVPTGPVRPAPDGGLSAPAQLPADVPAFTGRAGYLDQLDRLLPDAGGAVVIGGSAGVGKTALTVHWGHRVRHRFSDGQLYVNLRGYDPRPPVRPIEALTQLLHGIGVPLEKVPTDVEQASGALRSMLADKRVLLVLDNARDADQVRPLLPGTTGCLVLITSRDHLTGLVAREGARHVALDVLAPDEALALLDRIAGTRRVPAEPAAAADLVRACAYLPLAVRIAAANLAITPHATIAGYLARLRGGDPFGALAADGDRQVAVRAAFELSYAALPASARRLFRLSGLVPGPDVTAEAAGALAGISTDQAAAMFVRLAGAHLVEPGVDGRYACHDLLRAYAAQQAWTEDTEADRHAALDRLLSYYLREADAAAQVLYPQILRLASPEPATNLPDRAQALAWLDAERPNLVAAVTFAADHGFRPAATLLADTLRGYFLLRVRQVDWLTVARAGLSAAVHDADPRGEAAGRLSLALLAWRQSRHTEAVDQYLRARELCRVAGWLEGEAAALGNLGSVYWGLDQLDRATEYLTEALAINGRLGWLAGQAANHANLGAVLWERGHVERAADHHRRALELYRRTGADSGVANELANLGEVYLTLGRLDAAIDALTQALVIHRDVGNRENEGDTLRILSEVHREAGRFARALEVGHAALAALADSRHRRTEADALNAVGAVHHRLGEHRLAAEYHERALRVAIEDGGHRPEEVALVGLAAVHLCLSELDEAERMAGQALAVSRQTGHRVTEGQALAALAAVRLATGRPAEAAALAEEALALQRLTGHRLGAARTLVVLAAAVPERAPEHRHHALELFTEADVPEVHQLLHGDTVCS